MSWIILAPLSVAFTLLAILLAPVLALLVKPDGCLPDWLNWFQTPDNPATGDMMFQQNQMSWTTSRYLYALFWLARNPAYGFDHLLGAKIKPEFQLDTYGDLLTGNNPIHNGFLFCKLRNKDGSRYWQFYFIHQWSTTKCWKINFGWKLWGKLEAGQVRQLVCTMSPFAKVVL